ncbi:MULTISPECIES: prepilin-type N-terminal cleavage/methylation domain-containing protein [unclassified Thiocapsa]
MKKHQQGFTLIELIISWWR